MGLNSDEHVFDVFVCVYLVEAAGGGDGLQDGQVLTGLLMPDKHKVLSSSG